MLTNVTTLTLVEETQLWVSWALGDHIEDVGQHSSAALGAWALRDAPLMELALRGRVRIKRFKPISRHSRYRHRPISRISRVIACFLCLCLVVLNIPAVGVLSPFLSFFLQQLGGVVGLYFILGFIDGALFQRKLVLVDAAPTGDAILDDELHARFLTGSIQKLRGWLSSKAASRSNVSFEIIEQRLAEKGALIAQPAATEHPGSDKSALKINEASEAWQALCRRLRTVLLGAVLPDAQTIAFLLLITFGDLGTFTKRPNYTAPVLTLVSRKERAASRQRLAQILIGEQTLAAQVGETLYDTLLGIRDNRVW